MKRLLNFGIRGSRARSARFRNHIAFAFTFRRPFGSYDWFGAGEKIYGRRRCQQASGR